MGLFKRNKNKLPKFEARNVRYVIKCDDIDDIAEVTVGAGFHVTEDEGIKDIVVVVDSELKDCLFVNFTTKRYGSLNNGVLSVNLSGRIPNYTNMTTMEVILPKRKVVLNYLGLTGVSSAVLKPSIYDGAVFETCGSSSLTCELVGEGRSITFKASGSSEMAFLPNSKADSVALNASGASNVFAQNIETKSAMVAASGVSKVTINAKDYLKINASGASHVSHYGTITRTEVNTGDAASVTEI